MTAMNRSVCSPCAVLLLGVLLAAPGQAADTPARALDGWDAFVEKTMADGKAPGLSLAVVRDDKVIIITISMFTDL